MDRIDATCFHTFKSDKRLHSTQKLTDQGKRFQLIFIPSTSFCIYLVWKTIEPELVAQLIVSKQHFQARDLEESREKRHTIAISVAREFCSTLPSSSFIPPLIDLLTTPGFKSVIFDTPLDQEVVPESFGEAVGALPEFISRQSETTDTLLLSKLPNADAPKPNELSLATTVFVCKQCETRSLWYSQARVHACSLYDYDEVEAPIRALTYRTQSRPWDHRALDFDADTCGYVKALLGVLGMEPETTAAEDLHNCNRLVQVPSTPPVLRFGYPLDVVGCFS